MKEIYLTKDQKTIIDDEVYDYISQWKWYCHKGYARRSRRKDESKETYPSDVIHMSREIWKLIGRVLPKGYILDHINGDKLDNRLVNLRACTQGENVWNTRIDKHGEVPFRGVIKREKYQPIRPYVAQIDVNKKRIIIGSFASPIEAARAYNEAAKKYHGEFAILNNV